VKSLRAKIKFEEIGLTDYQDMKDFWDEFKLKFTYCRSKFGNIIRMAQEQSIPYVSNLLKVSESDLKSILKSIGVRDNGKLQSKFTAEFLFFFLLYCFRKKGPKSHFGIYNQALFMEMH